jgi:hypothetical protein
MTFEEANTDRGSSPQTDAVSSGTEPAKVKTLRIALLSTDKPLPGKPFLVLICQSHRY